MEQRVSVTEERFRDFCKETLPLVNKLTEELKKLVGNTETMASVSIAPDGYFTISVHDSGWSMIRLGGEKAARIRHDYQDTIELEEGK